jgi:pimeloyl-ACP methyl ester carboxylesterase
MNKTLGGGLMLAAGLLASTAQAQPAKPTVVLVHGAFADSSSWNGVITILERDGYKVVAAPNPLRGVRADADVIADVVRSINGPVVLVGHSYGGSVISEAAEGQANVKGLVYVAAFAPDAGETALGLTGKFPGSTLAPAIAPPVKLTSGGNDLYILQARFHDQFAADVPAADAQLMAAGQRPISEAALTEPSTEPAWKTVPSWFVYGDDDRNIPPAAMAFMAERAKSRQTVVVKGASHVVMVSHASEVAGLIERAATAR